MTCKKKKYYAVKIGHIPGVYEDFDECQRHVKYFPGADYRVFRNREEALAYVGAENTAIAYVDGSFNPTTREYACGIVMMHDDQKKLFSIRISSPDQDNLACIRSEIVGSARAMQYCAKNGIENLDLYYDFEGVENWCTGVWQTKKKTTEEYRDFYVEVSKNVNIRFHKVKAHTGVKYNEWADYLAKQAIGVKKRRYYCKLDGEIIREAV